MLWVKWVVRFLMSLTKTAIRVLPGDCAQPTEVGNCMEQRWYYNPTNEDCYLYAIEGYDCHNGDRGFKTLKACRLECHPEMYEGKSGLCCCWESHTYFFALVFATPVQELAFETVLVSVIFENQLQRGRSPLCPVHNVNEWHGRWSSYGLVLFIKKSRTDEKCFITIFNLQ